MDHDHKGLAAATAMSALGDGRWATTIDDGWSSGGRPNGGYLLASIAAAGMAETGRDLPLGVTAAFTRPPEFGPAVMVVETIRAGRTVSAMRVRVEQHDVPCAEGLLSLGDAAQFGAEPVGAGDPPAARPRVGACVPGTPRLPDGTPVPILKALEVRLDPACVGWFTGRPA